MSDRTIDPAATSPGRLPLVDAARGVALAAMIVYHFSWDLSYFRFIATDVANDPGWRLFARAIAGSFLVIVGVSLVLATRGGFSRGAYLKRLGLVAGAAAAITLATWKAFPDSFIFFGILHHIALASVLALPFLRLPVAAVVATAVAIAALPFAFQHEVFAQPALLWTGLAPRPPVTNDYVPLFPWFGAVLAGVAAARLTLPRIGRLAWTAWAPGGPPGRVLAWSGRRSLWVYLIHQPVLIGVLWLAAQELQPGREAQEAAFAADCRQSCLATATGDEDCARFCGCAADQIKTAGLWNSIMTPPLSEEERARMVDVTAICRAR